MSTEQKEAVIKKTRKPRTRKPAEELITPKQAQANYRADPGKLSRARACNRACYYKRKAKIQAMEKYIKDNNITIE